MKGIARDSLRMKMVIGLQSRVASVVSTINSHNESITELKKDQARVAFRKSQIADGDPDAADKAKDYDEQTAELDKAIESTNKRIEDLNKAKLDEEAKITKVENGEVKVNLDELNDLTEKLIVEVTKDTAVAKAKELSA